MFLSFSDSCCPCHRKEVLFCLLCLLPDVCFAPLDIFFSRMYCHSDITAIEVFVEMCSFRHPYAVHVSVGAHRDTRLPPHLQIWWQASSCKTSKLTSSVWVWQCHGVQTNFNFFHIFSFFYLRSLKDHRISWKLSDSCECFIYWPLV